MKSDSVFINASRGQVVNEEELYKALKNFYTILKVFVTKPYVDLYIITIN